MTTIFLEINDEIYIVKGLTYYFTTQSYRIDTETLGTWEKVNQSEDTSELPPFSSFFSDVRTLLSRPNQIKLRPDSAVLGRQHRREYYTNHARRTRRPRFNQQLQYCLKPEFCKWEIIFWDGKRQEYTIQNTFLPSQRLIVPPQAITALPL